MPQASPFFSKSLHLDDVFLPLALHKNNPDT